MRPLEGVDVVDFTQVIAGPVCTQLLAGFGAHVVKVEPPTGDKARNNQGTTFTSFNTGKESIGVDMKNAEGERIVQELVERADVVVENFRPGVMRKFELDYETVRSKNEDVVYCSISGFGQEGPYTDRPAFDPIVQAMSGVEANTGYPDRLPVRIGTTPIDIGTGTMGALSIVAALHERDRTGEGKYVDVSLFDIAIQLMGSWVAKYSQTGSVPTRAGSAVDGSAPNEIYRTGDDGLVHICVNSDELFDRLCDAIAREDLREDDRFSDGERRWENREELREELERSFGEYPVGDLVETLTDAGVPAGPVQRIDEVVDDDPHVEDRRLLAETVNPTTDSEIQVPALPIVIDEERIETPSSPPKLGEHSRTVLSDLGYAEEEIDELFRAEVVSESS